MVSLHVFQDRYVILGLDQGRMIVYDLVSRSTVIPPTESCAGNDLYIHSMTSNGTHVFFFCTAALGAYAGSPAALYAFVPPLTSSKVELLNWSPSGAQALGGITYDATTGLIYILLGAFHRIDRYHTITGQVETNWAPTGTESYADAQPAGIAVDETGKYLFVSCQSYSSAQYILRKYNTSGVALDIIFPGTGDYATVVDAPDRLFGPTPPALPPVQAPYAPQSPPTTPPPLLSPPVVPPAAAPKSAPVAAPVLAPVASPQASPVASPVGAPVSAPTASVPKAAPAAAPISPPSAVPALAPVATPAGVPVSAPLAAPAASPLAAPSLAPVAAPIAPPVASPTASPTATPAAMPSQSPSSTATPAASGNSPLSFAPNAGRRRVFFFLVSHPQAPNATEISLVRSVLSSIIGSRLTDTATSYVDGDAISSSRKRATSALFTVATNFSDAAVDAFDSAFSPTNMSATLNAINSTLSPFFQVLSFPSQASAPVLISSPVGAPALAVPSISSRLEDPRPGGVIVGIVLGTLAGVGIVIAIVLFIRHRRRQRRAQTKADAQNSEPLTNYGKLNHTGIGSSEGSSVTNATESSKSLSSATTLPVVAPAASEKKNRMMPLEYSELELRKKSSSHGAQLLQRF